MTNARSTLRWTAALVLFACSPARDEKVEGTARQSVAAAFAQAAAGEQARSEGDRRPAAASPSTVASLAPQGDPMRGRELAVKFECNRCHDGAGDLTALGTERHCTHCHDDIETGRFGAGTPKIGHWQKSAAPYRYAPSLEGLGKRLRPGWVSDFVQHPFDLRPNLAATMPRLRVDAAEARDLAAFVTGSGVRPATSTDADGDASAGRTLIEAKGCGGCHVFTGVPALPVRPDLGGTEARRKAAELAPDLRFTRDRFEPSALVPWLLAPASLKPGTSMPTFGFTEREARDIASYLLTAPLSAAPTQSQAVRLPFLHRPVTYAEVEARVFSTTCRHCHADPDVAGGDGGPGNTGGFGFSPRGLDLTSYESTAAGFIGDDGRRQSVFERSAAGVPLLVAALVARRNEETGGGASDARGMPLGLPSVGLEDIQLLESWIEQGRPR